MKKIIVIALLSSFLFACSSTTDTSNKDKTTNKKSLYQKQLNKLSPEARAEVDRRSSPEYLEAQQEHVNALKARGFYINPNGDVNYYGQRVCNNLEIQSHRGHVNYPENSIDSIKHALWNGFDVVEIDVMSTRDKTWVLHHDKETGRSTGTVDNVRRTIYRTKDKDLNKIAHRDMETGKLTNIRIPTAQEAFRVFSLTSNSSQYLNIEIKESWNDDTLARLEMLAFRTIPNGRYFFSSMKLKNLEKIRNINPDIRLNYINPVHAESLRIKKRELQRGVKNDPIYEREKRKRGFDDSLESEEKSMYEYNRTIKSKGKSYFDQKIGPNYSFSDDIRRFKERSVSGLAPYRNAGIIFSTYSINGQEYHERVLKSLPKSKKPDSVIIDDTAYGFCSMWGLPKKKPFKSDNTVAQRIYDLPIDVDLERINQLTTYEKSGLYPAIGGDLKPYKKVKKRNVRRMTVGKKQVEEDFELESGKAIAVDLRNKNKNDNSN